MNLIVSVDNNWAIGRGNSLLYHISEDMKRFKALTVGNVVVMGENTFRSLPGERPLSDRTNIVLSDKKGLKIDGVTVVNSPEELMERVAGYDTDKVFVIGGMAVYALMLDRCKYAYITRICADTPDADKFFPDLESKPNWSLKERGESLHSGEIEFRYDLYINSEIK